MSEKALSVPRPMGQCPNCSLDLKEICRFCQFCFAHCECGDNYWGEE